MGPERPRARPTGDRRLPPVAARLLTAAPEGRLQLEFSPPPEGTWTLVRAELARRLAEQAVSQAAAVSDAELASFAVGRGLSRAPVAGPGVTAARPDPAAPSPTARPAPPLSPADAVLLPDMLTGEALARHLGVSRATVALRRLAGRLVALESGTKRGYRYPEWQVGCLRAPTVRPAFERALGVLAPRGPWAAYRFFTEPSAALADRTPLEVFGAGDPVALAGVVDAAVAWR